MSLNIRLKIGTKEYPVLRFHYGFKRKINANGWPLGGMAGGEIILTMESTKDTELLNLMVNHDLDCPARHPAKAISGSIEIYDVEEQTVVRDIAFEEAYIYSFNESMKSHGAVPMTQTIAISPLRLDINGALRLDRRFPQTYAFWWEEYKPEEQPVMASEEEQNYIIKDAYWLDKENNQIRDLSVDVPVTLYVVLENYTAGRMVNFLFEDEGEDGVKKIECSGTVDSDGIVVIENFKFESTNKEGQENG